MRVTGHDTAAVAAPELLGPVFTYREPQSEQLLWARAAWSLAVLPELPAVRPAVAPLEPVDADRSAEWLKAWHAVWERYAALYTGATSGIGHATEHADWLASIRTNPSFLMWTARLPVTEPLGARYAAIARSADAAARTGIACVAVLPVQGTWWERPNASVLLVSSEVHDDDALLNATLTQASGRSGDRPPPATAI